MYDEDNSRMIDLKEMINVMEVYTYHLYENLKIKVCPIMVI